MHELQQAGAPLLERLAERFGEHIIRADGSLDRAGLAAIAFHDDRALADLEAIVHPAVRAEIARRIDAERGTDNVVVLDTPLLTVASDHDFAAVVVVDVPIEIAVQRLVQQRGMDEADVRARMAKQLTRDERIAVADHVVDNGGDEAALDAEVERCGRGSNSFRLASPRRGHVRHSSPSSERGRQLRQWESAVRVPRTHRVAYEELGPLAIWLQLGAVRLVGAGRRRRRHGFPQRPPMC